MKFHASEDCNNNETVELIMKHFHETRDDAGKQREHLVHDHVAATAAQRRRKGSAYRSRVKRLFAMLDNNLWLLSGMAVGIAALMITGWIVWDGGWAGNRLLALDQKEFRQTGAAGSRAIEKLDEQITGLSERVQMLTDSVTYLETKLIRAHVITDSMITAEQKLASSITPGQPVIAEAARDVEKLPPPAAGQKGGETDTAETPRQASAEFTAAPQETTVIAAADSTTKKPSTRQSDRVLPEATVPVAPATDTVAGKQSNIGEPARGAAGTAAVAEPQAPVSKQHPAMNPGGGPWVINLVSSPSQADADRFAAKAQDRGIETQQRQVTVKGKHYWRVQTSGFSTAEAAQAYAGTVRERLGLKDVWITTR